MRKVLFCVLALVVSVVIVSGCVGQTDNYTNNGTLPDIQPHDTTIDCNDVITESDLSEVFGKSLSVDTDDGILSIGLKYHITTASFNNCYFAVEMPVEAEYDSSGTLQYTRYSNYSIGKVMVNDKSFYDAKKTALEQTQVVGSILEETSDILPKTLKYILPDDDGISNYEATFLAGMDNGNAITVDIWTMNMGGRLKLFVDVFKERIHYENAIALGKLVKINFD